MSDRTITGRFLPGHSLPGPGRPKREAEQETLDALQTAFPAERIVALLERALTIAEETNSARGIVAVVTDVLDRLYGKPVPATQQQEPPMIDAMLAILRKAQTQQLPPPSGG